MGAVTGEDVEELSDEELASLGMEKLEIPHLRRNLSRGLELLN